MNSTMMFRHLDAYFEVIATAKTAADGLRLLRLARESQTATTVTLTARQRSDALLTGLLRQTPTRQMTCRKLASVASVSGNIVTDAVRRGVLIDHHERGVRMARLPGVSYSNRPRLNSETRDT